ncbi:uncharacterized protein [Trachinotus anak]
MDEKAHSGSAVFIRLNPSKCEHLKPLSVYSKMITCGQKASLDSHRKFSNSFINFKIEVVNNCLEKRKFEHSSPDDGYESPAKKSYNSEALSPDLGCFMDDCSPPDSASPFTFSASLDKTHALRSEIKESVNSQLHSVHVDCGSSTEPGGDKRTAAHSFKCENVVLNLAPTFDCDVDDILCLNPVGTYSDGGLPEHVDSCKSSDTFQNKADLIPAVAHGQELERGDGQVDKEREERTREMHLNVKDEDTDKGYFSMSYIKNLKTGKSPPQCGYPQLFTAASSPLHRIGEIQGPQNESHPENSSEQAMLSGQQNLFSVSDLCPTVSGPRLETKNSDVDSLDGDVEEMWNIGPPIFESSVCHSVTVTLNAGSEQSRQVIEEVCGDVMEPIRECQTTLSGEEATSDTSYETTLPLQVQVKSVVMVPNQQTSSKPGAPALPELNAKPTRPNPDKRVSQRDKCVSSGRSQRRVVFDREVDWERGKKSYVHAVTRHMKEKTGAVQDVMSELLNLMSHVADQTPSSHDRQWQHPSDLTRRNYQKRFGNMTPKMSLEQWQEKNYTAHKRFSKVPKIFERSPFP